MGGKKRMPQLNNPVYRVRVCNKECLPEFEGLVLPGHTVTPIDERIGGRIYLEDLVPSDAEHHAALGAFMDRWSGLESWVCGGIFTTLLGCDRGAARIIFQSMGMRQIIDAITGLATAKLDDTYILQLTNLLERLSKANGKRNVLAHGIWTLEVVLWVSKGSQNIKLHFMREAEPIDQRVNKAIADFRNQKERVKYCFNIKRIHAAAEESYKLAQDFASFNEVVSKILVNE